MSHCRGVVRLREVLARAHKQPGHHHSPQFAIREDGWGQGDGRLQRVSSSEQVFAASARATTVVVQSKTRREPARLGSTYHASQAHPMQHVFARLQLPCPLKPFASSPRISSPSSVRFGRWRLTDRSRPDVAAHRRHPSHHRPCERRPRAGVRVMQRHAKGALGAARGFLIAACAGAVPRGPLQSLLSIPLPRGCEGEHLFALAVRRRRKHPQSARKPHE